MNATSTRPVGLILIAHGSPDPDWIKPLSRVLERVQTINPARPVALALLTDPPSMAAAVDAMIERGCDRIEVVAALLSAGGRHLKQDIPRLVEATRTRYPSIEIELRPGAVGEDEAVIQAIAQVALGD